MTYYQVLFMLLNTFLNVADFANVISDLVFVITFPLPEFLI